MKSHKQPGMRLNLYVSTSLADSRLMIRGTATSFDKANVEYCFGKDKRALD